MICGGGKNKGRRRAALTWSDPTVIPRCFHRSLKFGVPISTHLSMVLTQSAPRVRSSLSLLAFWIKTRTRYCTNLIFPASNCVISWPYRVGSPRSALQGINVSHSLGVHEGKIKQRKKKHDRIEVIKGNSSFCLNLIVDNAARSRWTSEILHPDGLYLAHRSVTLLLGILQMLRCKTGKKKRVPSSHFMCRTNQTNVQKHTHTKIKTLPSSLSHALAAVSDKTECLH